MINKDINPLWEDDTNAVPSDIIHPKKPNNSSAAATPPTAPVQMEEELAFVRTA